MLTIFTTPKPFLGHDAIIQKNAIRSWTLLRPTCEVILFGNDEGTAELASELGLRHVPQIECNEFGTPLVNAMFKAAQKIATYDLICYINADIILMSDFLDALQRIIQQKHNFLMVGQRRDADIKRLLQFEANWQSELRKFAEQNGSLHGVTGIDYFVFPKNLWDDIPPFAIGRPGWDNWMIYRARTLNIPVIDATQAIMAVHQNHGYGHVAQSTGQKWKGPEADTNIALVNPFTYVFTLDGANWRLTPRQLMPNRTFRHLRQRLNAWVSFRYPTLRKKISSIFQATLLLI